MGKEKLCGCLESCFTKGTRWGHLEGVLCEHLSEKEIKGKDNVSICDKTNEQVRCYSNKKEFENLKRRDEE